MTDQKLVDELEKALRDEAYDGGFGYMGDEQFTAYVRTLAETAAEVFEKALTPTDDEREDMIAFLLRDHHFEESPWGRTYTDAEIAAALRRSEVPEPPTRDEREALIAAVQHEPDWDAAVRGKPMLCSCGQSIPEPDWDAVYMHRADAVLASGFRHAEGPEPSADLAAIVLPDVNWDRFPHLDTEEKRRAYVYALAAMESGGVISPIPPKPQGEPTDALCGDWPAPCNCDDPTTHDGSVPASLVQSEQGEPSDAQVDAASREIDLRGFHIPPMAVRAALRAAGVRGAR